MGGSGAPHVILWLRRAWRLHDNPALQQAWAAAGKRGANLHVIRTDTHRETQKYYYGGARRRRFVEESIAQFQGSLKQACDGEVSFVTYALGYPTSAGSSSGGAAGAPPQAARHVADVRALFTALVGGGEVEAMGGRDVAMIVERVYTPPDIEEEAVLARCVDDWNASAMKKHRGQVKITAVNCFNLCGDFADLCVSDNIHENPLAYNPFVRRLEEVGVDAPVNSFADAVEKMMRAPPTAAPAAAAATAGEGDGDTAPPLIVPPGEAAALARMHAKLADPTWVVKFSKPFTKAMVLEPSTTVLSPYLATGLLSVRLFHELLDAAEATAVAQGEEITRPPQSLKGQLYWREFSHFLGCVMGRGFDGSEGRVHPCLLDAYEWDTIAPESEAAVMNGDAPDHGSGEDGVRDPQKMSPLDHYRSVYRGNTGYPSIDAGVAQLKQQGWMHHIYRHLFACFITRGYCGLDWRLGQRMFEAYLLDYDWAINAGQWQWLSCSFLFFQFNRTYHPFGFAKKHDPTGAFRRRYLGDAAAAPPDARVSELDRVFARRSEELKARMKRAYLDSSAGFLKLLQSNVLAEWQKDDPDFAARLKTAVRTAKNARLHDPCAYDHLTLPKISRNRASPTAAADAGRPDAAAVPPPPPAASKLLKPVGSTRKPVKKKSRLQ